jgi:hypothetical protein
MKVKLLLRIASACVLFFAAGHLVGHLTRKSTTDPTRQEVFKQMEEVKFPIGTQFRSYDEFFNGMSINFSIALASLAILLWLISNSASSAPKTCYLLLWPVLICLVGFAITGFIFFFLVPAVTCVAASFLILMAINSLHKHNH